MPLIRLTDDAYRHYAQKQPELPLWQSPAWKAYQACLGRKTLLYGLISDPQNLRTSEPQNLLAAALVIIDRTVFGLSTWDIPRGPTGNPEYFEELLSGIIDEAKKKRCMALYFSPLEKLSISNNPAFAKAMAGKQLSNNFQFSIFNSQFSRRHEHPEATIFLDLTKSDEEILKGMHEKGRYNIRLAQRHGIEIKESKDTDAFYGLLKQTGKRDRYGIKPQSHYEKFLTLPKSFLLLASDSDTPKKPLAGLLGVISGETGIYYYGASDHAGRAKMAPSLLQFEAMKFCQSHGARTYDLFGIDPPRGGAMNRTSASIELSTGSASSGSWSGVTRFKKQFGGEVVMYPPEREVTLMPIVKKLIEWKRRVARHTRD